MAISMFWNVAANKLFESGLDRGVLYVRDGAGDYPLGVPWEGLMNLTEKPGGAEVTDLWANNAKYAQLISTEIFDGSLEAYTFPEEFLECMGMAQHADDVGMIIGQQARSSFGLCYRTWLGSEAAGQTAEYKIHIIYGCVAQPSEVARATVNDSPEAATLSWEFKTTPANAVGYEPISKITIDASVLDPTDLATIEAQLYGTDDPITANLPLPDDLFALLTP